MVSILIKIVVIVVSAIAGGFFGAWFSYRFQIFYLCTRKQVQTNWLTGVKVN